MRTNTWAKSARTALCAAAALILISQASFAASPSGKSQKTDKRASAASQSGAQSDSGKKSKWWKFWDRKKSDENTGFGWKGYRAGKGAITGREGGRPAFTTKTRRHVKPGESVKPNYRTTKSNVSKPQQRGSKASTSRTLKKYNKERFAHKNGTFGARDTKSNVQMRRAYGLSPTKTRRAPNTYSHKSGFTRDNRK